VPDIEKATSFYVEHLGFEVTERSEKMISVQGESIDLFIEKGERLGPVMEMTVDDVEKAKVRLVENGCKIFRWEANGPRYVIDPNGLTYHLSDAKYGWGSPFLWAKGGWLDEKKELPTSISQDGQSPSSVVCNE
jgi:catechol 2,3-dioxygenase-like lactoylglutathione lyase family enzyme